MRFKWYILRSHFSPGFIILWHLTFFVNFSKKETVRHIPGSKRMADCHDDGDDVDDVNHLTLRTNDIALKNLNGLSLTNKYFP